MPPLKNRLFLEKFLLGLNRARTNPKRYSDRLIQYIKNEKIIKDAVRLVRSEINKKHFQTDYLDISNLIEAYWKIFEEKKSNGNQNQKEMKLIKLVEDIRLPLPENLKKIFDKEYQKNVMEEFTKEYSDEFNVRHVISDSVIYNSEIAFILFLSDKCKKGNLDVFFEEDLEFIFMNSFVENNESVVIHFILATSPQ